MRNRIRKHCNTISAKGGEVNNKFKHSLTTNRPEALLDHAQVSFHNSLYQGGAEMWSTDNNTREITKKHIIQDLLARDFIHRTHVLYSFLGLDFLEYNHELNRHSKLYNSLTIT